MKITSLMASAMLALGVFAQEASYKNDFEQAELGSIPEEFLIIEENGFSVKQTDGNKYLEMPGAPLDSFGLLFGPTFKENAAASARFFGEARGRRYPTFDIGLNGVGGYRVRVSPAKRQLELLRSDAVKQAVPLEWQPGKWTFLKITVTRQNDHWLVAGKFWQEGGSEPSEPTITFLDKNAPPSGRASVFASPYSGRPIRFDDLAAGPAQ